MVGPVAHAGGAGSMAAGFSFGVNPLSGEFSDFANLDFSLGRLTPNEFVHLGQAKRNAEAAVSG